MPDVSTGGTRRLRDVGGGRFPSPIRWPTSPAGCRPPHGEVEARALLERFGLIEPREREVLILAGKGEQMSKVARSLGMRIGTAFPRLRRGPLSAHPTTKNRIDSSEGYFHDR